MDGMQGLIRCWLLAGLLCACHTSSTGMPDSPQGSGASGLHVAFAAQPVIPGNVTDAVTLDSAYFNFDNLSVIGDSGPGDNRTSAHGLNIHFEQGWMPYPEDFPDAPSGVYSKLSFEIDGHVVNASYRLKGKVNINGTLMPYQIEDRAPLSLSLDCGLTLQPGGNETITLLIKFQDALSSVDFASLPMDDGALTLEDTNSKIVDFRNQFSQAFSIQTSGPN
jgi:hypothetical protein